MIKGMTRLVALACAVALSLVMAIGCSPQPDESLEAQAANRQYMSKVNQLMDELAARLSQFDDAVSRGDTVSMRTQVDNTNTVLKKISDLEAPEVLESIQKSYAEGCESLKEALGSYVDLFTEIDSSSAEHPFDYSTYEKRISDIQAQYDAGITQLQEADTQATELE